MHIGIHIDTINEQPDPAAALKSLCDAHDEVTVCYGVGVPPTRPGDKTISEQINELCQDAGVTVGKLAADSDACRKRVDEFLTELAEG